MVVFYSKVKSILPFSHNFQEYLSCCCLVMILIDNKISKNFFSWYAGLFLCSSKTNCKSSFEITLSFTSFSQILSLIPTSSRYS